MHHPSPGADRAPPPTPEKARKSPQRRPGRAVFTLLDCPGELLVPLAAHSVRAARPTEQPSLRGEWHQAPQKRAARERESKEAGIRGRATHPWLPMLRRRVRHPRRARAPPRPAARARGRGQPRGRGGCARAPSSDAQTSLNSFN